MSDFLQQSLQISDAEKGGQASEVEQGEHTLDRGLYWMYYYNFDSPIHPTTPSDSPTPFYSPISDSMWTDDDDDDEAEKAEQTPLVERELER